MSTHSDVTALVALMKKERIAAYEGPLANEYSVSVKVTLHSSAFLPDAPPDAQAKPREPHPNPLFATDTEG